MLRLNFENKKPGGLVHFLRKGGPETDNQLCAAYSHLSGLNDIYSM